MPSATDSIYDPVRALAIAGGRPQLRDATLLGLLELLEDTRGPLGDVTHYAGDPATVYEVAHRAVGLARQAAMPALETLLRALADALEAGALEEAQRLGQCLPEALTAVRRVLAGGGNPE